jgi:hypothetical protein
MAGVAPLNMLVESQSEATHHALISLGQYTEMTTRD